MTIVIKRALPGESVQDHMSARTWNTFADVARRVMGDRRQGQEHARSEYRPGLVRCVNLAGEATNPRDILAAHTIGVTPANVETDWNMAWPIMGVRIPESGDLGKAVMMLDGAWENEVGFGIIAGVVPVSLFVPTNGAWITRADVDLTDQTRMNAIPNGAAQILWKDTGTNTTVDAVVLLQPPQMIAYPGKVVTSAISADSTGTVEIWQSGSTTSYQVSGVHLDWMHGDEQVSVGKEVEIKWYPTEQRWRITQAECET